MVKSPNTLHPTSPLPSAATPVVIVEDAGAADRQLHFMTSFSRTPSPVAHSDSGSDSELSSLQGNTSQKLFTRKYKGFSYNIIR